MTCGHFEILWLLSRLTLQNDVESFDVASSKRNLLDSVAATKFLIDIAVAFNELLFVQYRAARRHGKYGADGRLTIITRRPREGRLPLFACVARRSLLLTVSGLSLIGLFP